MGFETRRDYTPEGITSPTNTVTGDATESAILEPRSGKYFSMKISRRLVPITADYLVCGKADFSTLIIYSWPPRKM